MNNKEKTECEKLWEREKYLVLSKSQKIYKQIREYLKGEEIHSEVVRKMIEEAKSLPENRMEVVNALQHMWGYLKKEAVSSEKESFLALLTEYQAGKVKQQEVIDYLREMVRKYPNSYLQNSIIFF